MKACLGIDTATRTGSVALALADGRLLESRLDQPSAHARDLLTTLESLLARAGLDTAGLRAIGVTTGPGSFTGLRVGLATAKGLAYALGIAVEGLSTLETLARAAVEAAPSDAASLVPVIEAGRGEVYAAIFTRRGTELQRSAPDQAFRPEELVSRIPPGAVLVGDGAARFRDAERSGGAFEVIAVPPLAGALARWVAGTVAEGAPYRPGGLVPNYIRPSDAEAGRPRA